MKVKIELNRKKSKIILKIGMVFECLIFKFKQLKN